MTRVLEGGECAAPVGDAASVVMPGQTYCVGWVMARPPTGLGGWRLVDIGDPEAC